MADEIKVKVPDIGGASGVDVIELLVKPGDEITLDTPLITLESDKASMEIPSPFAGKISQFMVKVGDKVSEGDVILTLINQDKPAEKTELPDPLPQKMEPEAIEKSSAPSQQSSLAIKSEEIHIPDIGGATDVEVIEILVNVGDVVKKDQALITLEGDKATMDIPSPFEGKVQSIALNLGDKVAKGNLILVMDLIQMDNAAKPLYPPVTLTETVTAELPKTANYVQEAVMDIVPSGSLIAAGPSVRRMARELGVNLDEVSGSARKNRITKEDIQNFVKTRLRKKPESGGFSMPQAAVIDFSKFGEIETRPLNKIKRLTGLNVHRSWITIPHVTQFDEADITDLETFRKSEAERTPQVDYKLTLLAFVTKVVSKALMQFPQFNASLDASGENLILKQFYNIGIAVETPNGLVVPVIKKVDQLSVVDIAREMAVLSKKARDKGLMPADMNGGCFTISSLGGIGGTAFTPIVNSPEVAILGLSRSSIKPVYLQGEFKPRLMIPLSLSYDHRVIDGAEAARFTRYLADSLADIRRILL